MGSPSVVGRRCTRIAAGYAPDMTDPLPDPIPEPDESGDPLDQPEPLEPSVTNPDADGIDDVPS